MPILNRSALFKRPIPLFYLAHLILFYSHLAFAQDLKTDTPSAQAEGKPSNAIVLNIVLNQESKGEFIVNLTEDKDFLIRLLDLKTIGFKNPTGLIVEISGEPYLSLRSMAGVSFHFHENDLSLKMNADPQLLQKQTLDFLSRRQPHVYHPRDDSAFLNYRLNYTKDPSSEVLWSMVNQMGIRSRDVLFLSDSSYSKSEDAGAFTRLMSSLTYDRYAALQRFVLGDILASSGELGSGIQLGGIGFSKAYLIDPYFIKNPMLTLSGLVPLPSDVDIYLNGIRIRREKLSPGEFELRNLSYYGGAGLVEVVIRDPFGREQRIKYPVYFTNLLLRKGLHEYSYNVGFLREDFGIESNRYGDPALSAFHRYGLSDRLTFGIRGEATKGILNLGPQASYNVSNSGIASVFLSGSMGHRDTEGVAASLDFGYQGQRFNTGLLARGFTSDYATVGNLLLNERTKAEYRAGISYGMAGWGNVLLDFNATKMYVGTNRKFTTLGYSKDLSRGFSTSVTFQNRFEQENEFFVGLNYRAEEDIPIASNYRRDGDRNAVLVQAQKDLPVGEGAGYRVTVETESNGAERVSHFNPVLQYGTPYGLYEGEYSALLETGNSYRLSASGAFVYMGNTVGLIRPVTDSFGLVKVSDLKEVRVSRGGDEIGTTNASGVLFIPHLASYYDNQISINDADIPLDYTLPEVNRYISPPLRSGSCIIFDVVKQQYITGFLKKKVGDDIVPVEFYEIRISDGLREARFPTGKGGEFYFENVAGTKKGGDKGCRDITRSGVHKSIIKAGRYEIAFDDNGVTYRAYVEIPQSDEIIIDLGETLFYIP